MKQFKLMLVFVFIVYNIGLAKIKFSLEQFVPENTDALIVFNDLSSVWADIKNSNFYAALSESFPEIKSQKLSGKTGLVMEDVISLMGDKVVIAHIREEQGFLGITEIREPTDNTSKIIKELKEQESEEYQEIKIFYDSDNKISCCFVDEILCFSDSNKLARMFIDIYQGKVKDNITTCPEFKKLQNKISETAHMYYYFSADTLEGLGELVPKAETKLQKLHIYSYFFGEVVFEKGIYTSYYSILKQPLNPKLKQILKTKPKRAKSLKFIPDDIMIYGTFIADMSSVWQYIKEGETQEILIKTINEIEQDFAESTGLSWDKDFLGLLGGEIGLVMGGDIIFPAGETQPEVQVALFIQVKDTEKFGKIIREWSSTITQSKSGNDVPFEKQEYLGRTVYFLPIPEKSLKGLKLCYTSFDDLFVISVSNTLVKKMIEAYGGKRSRLEEGDNYKSLFSYLDDANNGICYFDFPILFNLIMNISQMFMPKETDKMSGLANISKWLKPMGVSYKCDTKMLAGKTRIPTQDLTKEEWSEIFKSVKKAFSDPRKSKEAVTKSNLANLRSALSLYYVDTAGVSPTSNPAEMLVPKYIEKIPYCEIPPHHEKTNEIIVIESVEGSLENYVKDTGKWLYNADRSSEGWRDIIIDCTHKDSEGKLWYKH